MRIIKKNHFYVDIYILISCIIHFPIFSTLNIYLQATHSCDLVEISDRCVELSIFPDDKQPLICPNKPLKRSNPKKSRNPEIIVSEYSLDNTRYPDDIVLMADVESKLQNIQKKAGRKTNL